MFLHLLQGHLTLPVKIYLKCSSFQVNYSAKYVAKEISDEMRFKIVSVSHLLTFEKTILLSRVSLDWTMILKRRTLQLRYGMTSEFRDFARVLELVCLRVKFRKCWSCSQLLLIPPPCRYDENLVTLLPHFELASERQLSDCF